MRLLMLAYIVSGKNLLSVINFLRKKLPEEIIQLILKTSKKSIITKFKNQNC